MSSQSPPANPRILLRKYQNRRYYDTSRSLHVTLEDIFNLVRAGRDIQVVDSKSGDDITTTVLAQIILEHDPLKLGVFPVELLHRIIRANEPLIRDFIDRYFNQFLHTYLESQRQFNRYWRQAMGIEGGTAVGSDWFRMMMWPPLGPPGPLAAADGENAEGAARPAEAVTSEVAELRKLVQELQAKLKAIQPPPGLGVATPV
jgi:polyhydroxyalkanoate synthesis repressor PhaR